MAKITSRHPSHEGQLVALKRIEGQVRGVQKMIFEKRYCIDILIQLNSIVGAVECVQGHIFEGHLKSCFVNAVSGKSVALKEKKINEVVALLKKFRKG